MKIIQESIPVNPGATNATKRATEDMWAVAGAVVQSHTAPSRGRGRGRGRGRSTAASPSTLATPWVSIVFPLKLNAHPVYGDGHCCYRSVIRGIAIAECVHGQRPLPAASVEGVLADESARNTEDALVGQTRHQVADHIATLWTSHLTDFCGPVAEYLEGVRGTTYGGELELQALANLHKRPIIVFSTVFKRTGSVAAYAPSSGTCVEQFHEANASLTLAFENATSLEDLDSTKGAMPLILHHLFCGDEKAYARPNRDKKFHYEVLNVATANTTARSSPRRKASTPPAFTSASPRKSPRTKASTPQRSGNQSSGSPVVMFNRR
jgi:hypothetical protein